MTSYPRSAYGTTNPNAGYPANGDFAAWGGYCWPRGVPAVLLGQTEYTNKTNGQVLRVTMRKELVPLWQLAFQICDLKWKYPIWSRGPSDGKPWGPWGYENRAISGTNRPSGHSAALSVDINAPYNPYSFTFESNMPPGMVADLESLGLYWGGRYSGQRYDAMHYGFCRAPSTVASYITKAKNILGQLSGGGDDDMTTDDSVRQIVRDELKKFFSTDVVKVTGDAMNTPADYDSTRDKVQMRILRTGTIGTATVTGRDGRAPVPPK